MSEAAVPSKSALVILRPWAETKDWWATVHLFHEFGIDNPCRPGGFCYDTARFPTKEAALKEAESFCLWKGLKIKEVCEKP